MIEPELLPVPFNTNDIGVYVHIPFCASRCDYCDFATWTDRPHLVPDYMNALVADVHSWFDLLMMRPATSIFFGGGTPSLVPAADLVRVVTAIPLAPNAEVTVECNPDTITPELLASYRAGGVNRVSLGVQSLVPDVLALLGRTHNVGNVRSAIKLVGESGFDSFSIDLIYGAVGESVDDWKRTLDEVFTLDPIPPHISAYSLIAEPGTALGADPLRHPNDDDQAEKYQLANEAFAAHGLHNYEISNWALPNHECRHNWLYWMQGDYVPIGCASHGHLNGRRWWNVRTPDRYLALQEAGEAVVGGEDIVEGATRNLEAAQLMLRTRMGVDKAHFSSSSLKVLDGLVRVAGDRVYLTPQGRLLATEVTHRLQAVQSADFIDSPML